MNLMLDSRCFISVAPYIDSSLFETKYKILMDQYPRDNWFFHLLKKWIIFFYIIMNKQQTYWILDQASDFVRSDLDPECLHYHVLMKEYPE